ILMNNLLKFASFCLFFLSFSLVGFGQADTANLSPDYLSGYGYVDSTYFENITFLESKITATNKISTVKNKVTGEVFTLKEEFAQFPGGEKKMLDFVHKTMGPPTKALHKGIFSGTILV